MPNINYRRGRSKEYRTMQKLRKLGCTIVGRSAGSHSAVDVFGIDVENKVIRLVQCKPKSLSENARQKIYNDNIGLVGHFVVLFSVE